MSATPLCGRPLWSFPLALAVLLISLAVPAANQETPSTSSGDAEEPQTDLPRFRVETNFVRADVFVTDDGDPVRDLRAGDFELLEDGRPQRIETFEYVEVRGYAPGEPRVEPQTVAQSRAMAEDSRARVFVIFLDTYHTDYAGSHAMQRAIANMLDRLLGPHDVFAVMTPQMSVRDLAFARRTEAITAILAKHWAWGTEGTIANFEPEEQAYFGCYPDPPPPDMPGTCKYSDYIGVAKEMIARRRERRSLQALNDLAVHLRDLREERKAVMAFTSGWHLYRPNQRLARKLDCDAIPGRQGIGVDPQGRLAADPRVYGRGSKYECDSDRLMLAQLDNNQYFLDILDRANRGNVSFYPVDAQGLRAWSTDLGGQHIELRPTTSGFANVISTDGAILRARLESLRTLAGATDGLAVLDTNDFDQGIQRIVNDLSSYYLLGYYSTNTKLDGKFRSIKVRVKRPGVQVRARRGYLAPTQEEVDEGRRAMEEREAEAPPTAVQTAFSRLQGLGRNVRLSSQISWVAAPIDGPPETKSHVWVTGEIDPATSRSSEWAAGGEAEVVLVAEDDVTVAVKRQPIEPAPKVLSVALPDVALGPGAYTLKMRLQPTTPGVPLVDTLRFTVEDSGTLVGPPRLLRRGPTTGVKYVETARPTFRRTERLRLEVPVLGEGRIAAELLDRNGKTMAVPVQSSLEPVEGAGMSWARAELVLAPLAPGDYAVRTSVTRGAERQDVVTAFRIVP